MDVYIDCGENDEEYLEMRKNKIKILHVAQAAGGVDRYIRMLLKYLDKEEFDNFVGKMAKNSYLIIPISYMTFMLSDDSLDEETFKLKNYRYYSFMKYRNMIGVTFKEYFKVKYLAFFKTDDAQAIGTALIPKEIKKVPNTECATSA